MENQQQRPSGRSLRGFASMDKDKQRQIASKGGRAAHEKGTAHEFSSHEASAAAKKGHERGTAHEFTPEEARVAGRKGGLARAQNRAKSMSTGESENGNGRANGNGESSSMGSEMETSERGERGSDVNMGRDNTPAMHTGHNPM